MGESNTNKYIKVQLVSFIHSIVYILFAKIMHFVIRAIILFGII